MPRTIIPGLQNSAKLTTFDKIWARLKTELNLHDGDLDVTYKVQVSNGLTILGYLGRGKVKTQATGFPHPSSAQRAIDSYTRKNPTHKCKILPWERFVDSVMR